MTSDREKDDLNVNDETNNFGKTINIDLFYEGGDEHEKEDADVESDIHRRYDTN